MAGKKTGPVTEDKRETVPFGKLNYILFAAGLLMITAGWFLLRAGHISVSPVMLVLGYCVVIPAAIIIVPGGKKNSGK
ncbi:MAG TPA: hypothetical protein PLM22_02985 [Candidatus Sabulitectum sp.]|nr:hypothetical protein [Candidatus Sabulitectum sp.]HPF31801.1 hypothetical protein [Candidatus Sabulitectum sp.]HPJ27870.1 hypothetical protein [Candidatus Sabulitectum sp.]HPR21901.1 hypothetical protein [Candidatus Sabulitectum sp.]